MATDQEYKYEEISVQVESKGELFEAKGKKILQYGWKLYEECFKNDQGMAMEEFCASEKEFPEVIKETIFRCVPVQKTVHYTTPPKEYTEDTLLAAMETAGNKDFEKETEKKGLGTPATRASIIEKLVFSKYAIRKGKQISCTEDGKLLIEVVPDYLKSAALTAEWENKLLEMEKGNLTDQSFLEGIKGMVMLLISDCRKLSSEQTHKFDTRKSIGTCPVCGNPVYGGKKNFYCSNRDCSFVLWKENNFLEKMGKTMDEAIATALLQKGRVTMTDLYSAKKNKYFNADLVMEIEDGKARFQLEFPKNTTRKRRTNRMDFKTFKEEVKENVRAHLPKEAKDVELSFGTYQKMNYSYEALFINIPEKNAQVSINLDELYEAYKDGQDLSKFYEIIPEIVESKEVDRAKEISFDYEQVKPHLFIRVDRVEGNENILENVPHCQMEDLALTYHVLLNKDGEGISKAMITNSWLEILGVTQEQLHQDALNNSQKLFPLSVMTITQAVMGGIDPTGVFASSQESLEEALKDEEIPLIVVTNKTKTDGAAALFYPEVMEQLGEKIGDFTILPSSTHETLILPDSEGMPIQHLKEMVAEVNGSFVEDADRLTDEVYHFDTKDRVFEKVDKFVARQKENSQKHVAEKGTEGIQKPKKSHEMSL